MLRPGGAQPHRRGPGVELLRAPGLEARSRVASGALSTGPGSGVGPPPESTLPAVPCVRVCDQGPPAQAGFPSALSHGGRGPCGWEGGLRPCAGPRRWPAML